VSALDSLIHRGLFADDAVAALFEDRAQIHAMLRTEAALARASAECGVIPAEAAERIAAAAAGLDPDPAQLAAGTTASGVPVGALVDVLRQAVDQTVGSDAASWVHWGATSQDIVDTALVLRLRALTRILDTRLDTVCGGLRDLARRYAAAPITARTRSQAAVPTCFGLKAAGWAAPLQRHRTRLTELEPRLLVVQLGGAAGTRSAFGGAGDRIMMALARELELSPAPLPWHTQRDALAELAGWLSLVTGSLAKLGRDVLLLAQTEVGELHLAAAGGSSTMPHKANPVGAEILAALAQHNAALLGEMHQALVHTAERDGAAWSSEWLALPQMAVAAGAALNQVATVLDSLVVDTVRMAANLNALNGVPLAEAASFALARHMPRPEAERLVGEAAARTRRDGVHLLDHLAKATDAPVDWASLRDPAVQLETARAMVERFLAEPGAGGGERSG